MLSVFSSPARYTQGRNATAALGAEMTGLGLEGPVLVVAGKSAAARLAATWKESLGAAGFAHVVHPFGGECSRAEIARVKAAAVAAGARTIVGAGGGKVIDTARAAAADLGVAVVSCPTIASSDAPCSALSVIYFEDGVFEHYDIHRRNPDLVLVDTQVIACSPARYIVAGMGDAAATWFEAKACSESRARNMRGGGSTRTGLALAELSYEHAEQGGGRRCSRMVRRRCAPSSRRP